MQNKFDSWREPAQLKQISIITFLTAMLYVLLSFIDRLIAPQQVLSLMILFHLYLNPSILLLISLLAYFKKFYSIMIIFLISAPIFAAFANIMIVSSLNDYSIYADEIYLIIFWIFAVSGLKLSHATISALLVTLVSLIGSYTIYNLETNEFIMHAFWMLASFTFGFAGAYLLEKSNKTIFLQQEKLSLELNNKNILLRELFHRVKNNLQIISGILSMQSKKIEDKFIKDIFKDSIQMIKSMGIIHEKLYQSDNLEAIDFNAYIESLIGYIKQNIHNQDIKFNIECDDIMITLENAVPIGLIVNEILTNCIKYAFDENHKSIVINIKMYTDNDERLRLEVSDNGKGINFDNFKKGFGFKLIDSLVVYQLKGDLNYYNENGLCYVIIFKKEILTEEV